MVSALKTTAFTKTFQSTWQYFRECFRRLWTSSATRKIVISYFAMDRIRRLLLRSAMTMRTPTLFLFILAYFMATMTANYKLIFDNFPEGHHSNLPNYQSVKVRKDECSAYGCPIYPAELTPKAIQYIKASFIRNNINGGGFPFASDAFAIVSQQGASHTENQDRATIINPFTTILSKKNESSSFVGLFDGHGIEGHIVASNILHHFPKRLANKLNSLKNPTDETILQVLNETFIEVDRYGTPNFLMGGSTATVALRLGQKLYIANAGDSQTVLFSVNSTTTTKSGPSISYMTRKDFPILPDENARITGLGGKVHINPNTNHSTVIVRSIAQRDTIMLSMSRGLGDWEWKAVGVTAEPLVGVVDLNEYPKSWLMMASDGVWDCRRREFYGKQFLESFYLGVTPPLLKLVNIFELVTPKNPNWYRDDMTAIVMRL